MTIDQINFAPLERSQNAFKIALKQLFMAGKGRIMNIFGLLVIFIMIFLSLEAFIVLLVFYSVTLVFIAAKIKDQAWWEFAKVNGWHMNMTSRPRQMLVPPSLTNRGHNHRYSEVVAANFNNINCDLMTYQFEVGHGKHSRMYYFTLAIVSLTKQFPHIILDSQTTAGIHTVPNSYQKLSLEGNFDKYFKLFLSPGEHIDVLSIITPDVMRTLIESNQQQDIEIYGQYLYFIGVNDKRTPEAMRNLLISVDKLTAEITHRARTLNYTSTQVA